jgi:parallel beta-helix repeat protein
VQGNLIGTDVSGHYDLGVTGDGIDLQGCKLSSLIGNIIGNNSGYGIFVQGSVSNTIQANSIGTDPTGMYAMGNGEDGINLQTSSATIIGGAGSGNILQFNNGAGINVVSGGSNFISANSIFDNAGPGIDLGNDGVTTNDFGDVDAGANQSQNYPVLTSVASSFGSTQVAGTLNSQPNTIYRVEFFSTPTWDATGIPEGKTYLGTTNVTSDGSGNVSFSVTLPAAVSSNNVVTATASDQAGNTSEFSFASIVTVGVQSVSLAIARSGSNVEVTWSSAATGFQLESAGSLTSPIGWQTITDGIGDNGILKSYVVTNAIGVTNQFFRLKK